MITAAAPSSKSISHRYLIATALASGESELDNVLESDDTLRTREILTAAGARYSRLPKTGPSSYFRVYGMHDGPRGGVDTPVSCYAHESGTTCRLLTAVLAAGSGLFRMHGVERLHQRPIGELGTALRELGCGIVYEEKENYPPLIIQARGLASERPVTIGMDESSQYLSGLLLAAPLAHSSLTFTIGGSKVVSWPYVGLTLQCLNDFGIPFVTETRSGEGAPWSETDWRSLTQVHPGLFRITVSPAPYRPGWFRVEGDWSNASYLVAAGVLGRQEVRVTGLSATSLQGDRALLDILSRMGASLKPCEDGVSVTPAPLHGITADMSACPDLVPTIAAVAAFADGPTTITNVAHLRIKESDRLRAPARALARIGVRVDEHDDGLTIHGLGSQARIRISDTVFEGCNDHRMVMSEALFSLRSEDVRPDGIRAHIDTPGAVNKSFPEFWHTWESCFED